MVLRKLWVKFSPYSTVPDHMPEKHRQYTQWNAERFIRWACDIGPYTEQAVKAIIAVEQQGYIEPIGSQRVSPF
jgi:hypothetical protein